MLKEVSGDILLTKADVIAHGIAPNDNFSSGLALSLRESWPALYKDFRHYCQTHHPDPGGLWTWGRSNGKQIVNLFTQESAYGHGAKPGKATTEYVNRTLKQLRKLVADETFVSLALPRLATGVGGLDWMDVKPLIEQHLGDLKIPVYIYTVFHAGQQAVE